MASVGHPGASATGVARAQQLKDQLYDSQAKLTDLFGDLEPKLMLDAIIATYCKAPLASGNECCESYGICFFTATAVASKFIEYPAEASVMKIH